jgi:hypothetical protein
VKEKSFADRIAVQEKHVAALSKKVDSLADPFTAIDRSIEIDQAIKDYAPFVDLHRDDLQDIGNDFMVGGLGVRSEPGGSRITGLIVNPSSISHTGAEFSLYAFGRFAKFTVMSLPPGGSGRFSVFVRGLDPSKAVQGTIRYQNSTVSYMRPR